MQSIHILYASTSGHTEYVVDRLIEALGEREVTIEKQRVELATPEDLLRGDLLILACGTWNTGGPEGQLNPHMQAYLQARSATVDLAGKPCAVIGLGDDRYHFTARAAQHLEVFVAEHGGTLVATLRIVNEPYGQEETVKAWAATLSSHFS